MTSAQFFIFTGAAYLGMGIERAWQPGVGLPPWLVIIVAGLEIAYGYSLQTPS